MTREQIDATVTTLLRTEPTSEEFLKAKRFFRNKKNYSRMSKKIFKLSVKSDEDDELVSKWDSVHAIVASPLSDDSEYDASVELLEALAEIHEIEDDAEYKKQYDKLMGV